MYADNLRDADEAFAAALPDGVRRPLTDAYLDEPRGLWRGAGGVVAAPRNVAEVSAIMALAYEARVAVVPFGGGTGLVGGQTMPTGPKPLIMSLERMREVRGIWPEEGVITVEAGLTLSELRDAAADVGRLFPLAIASQGTATIGGILATNAGGVNVLRWGNARDLCLGVEAVLAGGRVLSNCKRLRKDNMGYDLRNLLIGSEGSLAVITAASVRLVFPPPGRAVALFTVANPADALRLLSFTQSRLADSVSAFELISAQGFAFLAEADMGLRPPWPEIPAWSVLLELGLPDGLDPVATIESLAENAMEAGLVLDGVIAQSAAQADHLWAMREHIPDANRRIGAISSHDISLPLAEIARFIEDADAALKRLGDVRVNCFGHLGDGNLHYNVFPARGCSRDAYQDLRHPIKDLIHEMVHARGGSVSAEHGVGRLKTPDMINYSDPVGLDIMRSIKMAMDPRGILNPGAVLPS